MSQRSTLTRPAKPRHAVGDDLVTLPWAFDDGHLAWRKALRSFCRERVEPGAAQRSKDAKFDAGLVKELAQLGVFGLMLPEPHGSGVDLRSMCIALEELAYVDSSLAVTVHVAVVNAVLLGALLQDQPDRRDALLTELSSGEAFSAFSLTEPSGGSDASNVSTVARRDGEGWVLSGAKQFITNSGTPMSRYSVVFAATDGAAGNTRRPVSAFLVPLDAEGVSVAPSYDKLGWRSSDTHPVFFDSVRLPADALLGQEGRGMAEALGTLTWARIPYSAMAVGLARACLDESLRFTTERSSFGQQISSHQAVGFKLADMAADVATSTLQVYDAAWKHDNGHSIEFEAASAKLTACELANRIAYDATQLHGGYGFVQESAVVRHYQDARVLTIAEGTSEVQRLLIARYLGTSG